MGDVLPASVTRWSEASHAQTQQFMDLSVTHVAQAMRDGGIHSGAPDSEVWEKRNVIDVVGASV